MPHDIDPAAFLDYQLAVVGPVDPYDLALFAGLPDDYRLDDLEAFYREIGLTP